MRVFKLTCCASGLCLLFAGTTSRASPGDPTVDACTLLTRAEVEQVMGKVKAAPKSGVNDRLRTCEWQLANDKSWLNVWVYPQEVMQRARKQLTNLVPVKGIGEDAFMIRNDPNLDALRLFVKKGNAVVEVSVPKGENGGEAKVSALAKKAVARLQS